MALELTITAKGQVTLRRGVLDHLGLKAGDKVSVALLPDGRVELTPTSRGHTLASLYGALHRPGQRPITLEEMQEAIETGGTR